MKFEIGFNSNNEAREVISTLFESINKFENIDTDQKHKVAADVTYRKSETTNFPGGTTTIGQKTVTVELSEEATLELCKVAVKIVPLVLPIYTSVKALYHTFIGMCGAWDGALKDITSGYRKKFVPQKRYNVVKLINKELDMYITATIRDDGLGNIELVTTSSFGKIFSHNEIEMYMKSRGMLRFSNALAVTKSQLEELERKSRDSVFEIMREDHEAEGTKDQNKTSGADATTNNKGEVTTDADNNKNTNTKDDLYM